LPTPVFLQRHLVKNDQLLNNSKFNKNVKAKTKIRKTGIQKEKTALPAVGEEHFFDTKTEANGCERETNQQAG